MTPEQQEQLRQIQETTARIQDREAERMPTPELQEQPETPDIDQVRQVRQDLERLVDIRDTMQPPFDIPAIVEEPEMPEPQADEVIDRYTQTLAGEVLRSRQALETEYQRNIDRIEREREAEQQKRDALTQQIEGTITEDIRSELDPFREELEKKERERLHIEENFFANQQLVNEMESLLTDIQNEVRREREVTGLASIREPRISKAAEDAVARVGVIEAVMAARNNQINVGLNFIDRTVNAINADRQDKLDYYYTLLDFYYKKRDDADAELLKLDNQQEEILNAQVSLLEKDMHQAEANAQYIKGMMMDPQMAQILAQAGVSLNDTPEQVNEKLARFGLQEERRQLDNQMLQGGYEYLPLSEQYENKPEDQLRRVLDPQGNERVYWNPNPEDDFDYSLGGIKISTPTQRVIEGLATRDDLTPTAKGILDEDLIRLGLTQEEPQEWFIAEMEALTGERLVTITGERVHRDVRRAWDEVRRDLGMIPGTTTETTPDPIIRKDSRGRETLILSGFGEKNSQKIMDVASEKMSEGQTSEQIEDLLYRAVASNLGWTATQIRDSSIEDLPSAFRDGIRQAIKHAKPQEQREGFLERVGGIFQRDEEPKRETIRLGQ